MASPAFTRLSLPRRIEEALRAFRAKVDASLAGRVVQVSLFGSYSRGDWGPDSDVDVLVVLDRAVGRDRREVFDLATDVFFDTLVRVAPLVLSVEELATLRAREYLLARELDRDGVPL
jgi:predicted nucleotidyltransferase